MRTIFASDFHLKYLPNQEAKERAELVIGFIRSLIGNTANLILVGDVFDLWYAWDTVIIRDYFEFLRALADLKASGCRIVFLAGNHDFWFNGFLQEQGVEIYPETFTGVFDGKKTLVAHGDQFTQGDWRYKMFRYLTRNKIMRTLFKWIHPDVGLRLGLLMSRSSRKAKTKQAKRTYKYLGMQNQAQNYLQQGYDLVVMGHSHRATLLQLDGGIYANSGDWVLGATYLELYNGNLKLINYQKPKDTK